MLRLNSKIGKENLQWHFFGRPPMPLNEQGKPDPDWQQDVWDQYEKSLAFGAQKDRNTYFHRAMGCEAYGQMYTEMDLAIAPLQMNAFNDSKSEIKLIECGRYGIPLIASNVGCYSDVVKDWEHGFLLDPKNEPKKWTQVLARFCKDKQLRKECGQNLKAIVDEYYDINKSVGMRYDLYVEMLKLKNDAQEKVNSDVKDEEATTG
jgi:glycosyltransferase involved in cell wall biosynthesis